MKATRILFVTMLLVAAIGCGDETPPTIIQCEADTDCTPGCDGYDKALCSGDGVCFCADAIPTTRCTLDEDCAEDCSAYDSHSCSGGLCYCRDEADVQCVQDADCAEGCADADTFSCRSGVCYCESTEILPSCTDGSDCTCTEGIPTCQDNTCYCETTTVEPSCIEDADCECSETRVPRCFGGTCYCLDDQECPAVTRRDLVEAFYVALGYSGCPMADYENLCPDITDGLQACQWAALIEDGIVSPYNLGNCGPGDTVTRAQFVKILITAIDGLVGYVAPATPTFDDVDVDTWYYDYVEAAVQLGLVSGYVDDHGSLTGMFGPGDVATTCWMDEVLQRAAEGDYLPEGQPSEIVAAVQDVHPGGIVIAGSTEILSARYLVSGTSVSNPLTSLTVVNDLSGAFNAPEPTVAVSQVWVSCAPPSGVGSYTNYSGVLVNGEVTISSMNCYDETGNGLEVQLVFDVSHMAAVGESLSGAMFRIGIREDTLWITTGQDRISTFVVRKTKPTVSNVGGLSSTLINGDNRLYGFTVMADNAGSVSFGRFVFQVSTPAGVDVSDFKVYRGATLLTSQVNIYNAQGFDVGVGGTSFMGTSPVIVSFNNEEMISAGASQTYYLDATATGAVMGDAITVRLFGDDEPVTGISGAGGCGPASDQPCSTGNGNTGRVWDLHMTRGLFWLADDFITAYVENRNVIWSDRSADLHAYPTITDDLVEAGTGSYDWTNGYYLGIENLSPHTLTY